MKRLVVFASVGLLTLACEQGPDEAGDTGDGDADATGDEDPDTTGAPDEDPGDGDPGEEPGNPGLACLERDNEAECEADGCFWSQAQVVTTEPECASETIPTCLPPPNGFETCLSNPIEGCEASDLVIPGYLAHPNGGWIVVETCGREQPHEYQRCFGTDGPAICSCVCSI